jgi:hypothetical protein
MKVGCCGLSLGCSTESENPKVDRGHQRVRCQTNTNKTDCSTCIRYSCLHCLHVFADIHAPMNPTCSHKVSVRRKRSRCHRLGTYVLVGDVCVPPGSAWESRALRQALVAYLINGMR